MTPAIEYAEVNGLKMQSVIDRIRSGKLRGFKWARVWWLLDDHEDVPPAKVVVYKNYGETSVASLERRVEELEIACKEMQAVLAGRGYALLQPIVGRTEYMTRQKLQTPLTRLVGTNGCKGGSKSGIRAAKRQVEEMKKVEWVGNEED